MNYDATNEMFRIAADLINQSSRNIFLTGKAGTGKTTFLKYIKETCPKQMAVVAPTGVAAINAGGVTMHSFFQLPFGPFIPEAGSGFGNNNEELSNRNSLIGRLKMTSEKKKIIRELELLIIDEISMVRCDMLDAVDTILRHIRRKHHERFGGMQVLFIGDMYQLPPVIKEAEWNYLREYYNSPFFFDSWVIKEDPPLYIEFNKIYRQSEEKFIRLLNQVRNNQIDEEGEELLMSRFQPSFRRKKNDGYIVLTTHNEKAKSINSNELINLTASVYSFEAEITGDFPESAFPADELLQLKAGAQVMFIKNDSEKIKRYFNGKIGAVTEIDNEKIVVKCEDDPDEIDVKKEKWENIRYTMNNSTRQQEEEVLGTFTQYPLRLAWAITIHKSQGLTFEKAIIDAGEAFAPGQVYVALSRCTTLDGVVLQSRIKQNGFFADERIVKFSQQISSANQLQQELAKSRKNYQLQILLELFGYKPVIAAMDELKTYMALHSSSFNEEFKDWIKEVEEKINTLQIIAEKFQAQLKNLFASANDPESDVVIQERIKAVAAYFVIEQNKIIDELQKSPIVTDSRTHAKEFNQGLKEIFISLSRSRYILEGFRGRFETEAYHKRKTSFVVPAFTVNSYAGVSIKKSDSPHPALHQSLRKLRDNICAQKDLPIYIVAGSTTLDEMARYLPQSLEELKRVSGFGDAKIEKYGQKFLDVILEYSRDNHLLSLIHQKTPKRERKANSGEKKVKGETRLESFKLYKQGKTVDEIVQERNLTRQTIEGHLAYFVLTGEIGIYELVSGEKIALIEPEIKNMIGKSLTPIKDKLGNQVSFGEIRLVMAWVNKQKDHRPI
jgi:hypothetical protein